MITRLINAISRRLKECFPEIPNRYSFNPAQNIEEPCFIIQCVNQGYSDLLTYQDQREITLVDYLFNITLLLPRNDKLLKDVASRVLLCLKWLYLEDGKPVLTLNREAHPIDDSSYSFTFMIKREAVIVPNPPIMEVLNETVGLENEEKESGSY